MQRKQGGICFCYNFHFHSISKMNSLLPPKTMKNEEPCTWDAAPGPCGEEKWFCGRPGQVMDIKDNTDRNISKDLHEDWGCLLLIVSLRDLFFPSIVVVLEWPLWKMNSNGKATSRLTGDSKPPFLRFK